MSQTFRKDSDAVLDYTIDWTDYLTATSPIDSISTSTWTEPTGITVNSSDNSALKTTVWLSGGSVGSKYRLTNRIVTTGGRTDDRTITIVVVNK